MSTQYFKSTNVLLNEDEVPVPAILEVRDGKITAILPYDSKIKATDFLDHYILPGIVDTHAHINEPGRTDWEGFETATKAAAAGGITTVIDMPLNSIPATTSLLALEEKRKSAQDKCKIDYGYWGGVVPGNTTELEPMIKAGVMGFKCFLIESGVDEFKMVTRKELEETMPILAKHGKPLIVHAELESPVHAKIDRSYQSYLKSRPQKWEVEAIRMMIDLCRKTKCKTHIVHLSAADALPDIQKAKKEGLPFSVETCPHYLFFDAEHIHDGETFFKCAPPIREKSNQDRLWDALLDGTIDFVVSDHSPCTPALKKLETGNFEQAWGGIAGLQFSFQAVLTEGLKKGLSIAACNRIMSLKTAKFIGISAKKGKLSVGNDADFFVYNPLSFTEVEEAMVQHKHKITPYRGELLKGKILDTYLRGQKTSDGIYGKEIIWQTK